MQEDYMVLAVLAMAGIAGLFILIEVAQQIKPNPKKKKVRNLNIFLLYTGCCTFEIMSASHLLSAKNKKVIMCSLDGGNITAAEGFSISTKKLEGIDQEEIQGLIIPGSKKKDVLKCIDTEDMHALLKKLHQEKVLLAAIGNGVILLNHAGILEKCISMDDMDTEVYPAVNVITARSTGYIDFGIEIGKLLKIFKNDKDLQDTIHFWKGNSE